MQSAQNVLNKFQRTITTESGVKYVIRMLPAIKGLMRGRDLARVILPLMGGTLDGMNHDEFTHGAPRTFKDLAITLCEQSDKIDLEGFIGDLFEGAIVEEPGLPQRSLDFNTDFMANYSDLIQVLEFSLRENFGKSFEGKGIGHRLMGLVTKVSAFTAKE